MNNPHNPHSCPDCLQPCTCPTGSEDMEACTHCIENLIGGSDEGNYLDPSNTDYSDSDLSEENSEEDSDLNEENFIL